MRSARGPLLVAMACMLGVCTAEAAASAASSAAQQGHPRRRPLSADPVGPAVGTMIMVHAGGWAGHDAHAPGLLRGQPLHRRARSERGAQARCCVSPSWRRSAISLPGEVNRGTVLGAAAVDVGATKVVVRASTKR